MKKIIYILSLIVAFSVVSCVDLYELDSPYVEEEEIINGIYLADLSSDDYPAPTETTTWIILDEEADFEGFTGMQNALGTFYSTYDETAIDLVFPYLTAVPDAPDDYDIGAFCGAAIKSITLSNATYIGYNAFGCCWKATEINLPAAKTIEYGAFSFCSSLITISIPAVETMDNVYFWDCESLQEINVNEDYFMFEDGVLYSADKTHIYVYLQGANDNSEFYSTATSLSSYAFYNCKYLQTITLPNVTTIGFIAFERTTSLQYLNLATASGVKFESIHSSAFGYNCPTENIYLTLGEDCGAILVEENTYFEFDDVAYGPFKSVSGGTPIVTPTYSMLADFSATSYPTNTDTWVIENGDATMSDFEGLRNAIEALWSSGREISLEFPNLLVIPERAIFGDRTIYGNFSYFDALVSVSADVAISVDAYAFWGSRRLETLSLPKATFIGDHAFVACDGLVNVELPLVTTIDDTAFSNCDGLINITLPSVTNIGYYAFNDCELLSNLTIATNSDAKLESIDVAALNNTETQNITLTIGSTNSEYINGNTLTVGDFSATFKEIVISTIMDDTSLTQETLVNIDTKSNQ